jgi:hypothetical protein
VDWGAAARVGPGSEARRGVPAYSASALVAAAKLPPAHPAIDAAGALYTWLALAYGRGCVAPWLRSPAPASDKAMLEARQEWVVELAGAAPRVARVEAALGALDGALGGGAGSSTARGAMRGALAVAAEALRH